MNWPKLVSSFWGFWARGWDCLEIYGDYFGFGFYFYFYFYFYLVGVYFLVSRSVKFDLDLSFLYYSTTSLSDYSSSTVIIEAVRREISYFFFLNPFVLML